MEIFYTQHILERMEQRGISKDILQYTWTHGLHSTDEEWKVTVTHTHKDKNIKIIAKKKGKHFILVTSYYYD